MKTITANLNRIARRYGKRKKRLYRLRAALKRPPVVGMIGVGEASSDEQPS